MSASLEPHVPRSIRTALISTDREFRSLVKDVLLSREGWGAPALEITVPLSSYSDEHVRDVRALTPDLVILDLDDQVELGVRLAEFLSESMPSTRFIAAGPALAPDQLLAVMRAGAADYLPKPVSAEAVTAAMSRVRLSSHAAATPTVEEPRNNPGKIFAFFGAKGGAGTTTATTNFGIALHQLTGKKTLLVDLDLELGEVALLLGVQPRFNFVDMVQNFHRMDAELLASYIERHDSGVHLLSAPYQPDRAEVVTGEEIRRILHFLRHHYDYVVVDASKSFSPSTLAVFELADAAFVVTTVDLASLRNLQRGLPLLTRMLVRGASAVHLVVNRFQSDLDISLADVERTIGLTVYRTLANDYEGVSNSISRGKPIVLDGKSKYAQDIKALSAEVAGLPDPAGGRAPRFKALGRLFGRTAGRPEEATS